MPEPDGTVTLLLTELREGNQRAANRLMPLIYASCAGWLAVTCSANVLVILFRRPRW
jgi:hypothetical protein